MSLASAFTPVLVGRAAQMRSLDEHLGAAERSNGRVVLLAGDTGMGKTRLLFEFLRRVRASGKIDVLEGRGYEQDQATAFGPLLEALQAARRPGAGRAPRERTEWEGLRKELSRPHPDRQSLQSLQLALRPAAGEKTRLLALEDLHWSDPASLEALHLLARGMDRERLLLLGTYRTDEVGRGHALTHWIAQWTRARQLVEIAVPPLPRDELAMLVDAVLGLAASPGFTSALYERTGGNPLFAEEVLRRWIEEQGIEAVRRAAQAGDAPPPGGVPPAVKESVLTRAEKLGAPTRALLCTAAVLGRWFDFDLLKRVSGEGEQEVLQAVGEMVDAGMVQELAGKIPDRFAFRNVLTREAIYDDLLGREKRSLHLKVLAALESEATGGEAFERAGALAYHSLQARDREKAQRYSILAGDLSVERHAYTQAVAHYQAALGLSEPTSDADRSHLLTKLGTASYPLGDTRRTIAFWEAARSLFQLQGDALRVADLDLHLSSVLWEAGDHDRALEKVRAATQTLESLPPSPELAMAYAKLAQFHMLSSRPEESLRWGERALQQARELGQERIQVHALISMGTARMEMGEVEQGIASLEESLERALRNGWVEDVGRACNNLSVLLGTKGDLHRAVEVHLLGLETYERSGWDLGRGYLQSNLGVVYFLLGEWDAAQDFLDRAIRAGEAGFPMARLNAIPWRAALEMRRGRGPLALSWLETARPEVEKLGEFQHMRDFYPVLAECLRQGGRREDALQAIDHVVAVWRPLAPLPGAVPMLGEAVGVYASLGKTEVADELARALQASVERLPTARNQAWLSEALGVLALARGESASAEAYLSKAGEGWRSMGMAYFGARNYFRQAQAGLAGKRDLTAVRTHLRSAREILERLRAQADLAALAEVEREAGTDSKATPELLTPREQEVMTLLAQGMTNREIARQLVISVKTAEIHVSNILAKLGLTSRAQVAARVAQEGLAAEPTGWAAQADRPRPGSRVT